MSTAIDLAQQQIAAGFAGDWEKLSKLYAQAVHYVDPDGEWNGRDAVIAHLKDGMDSMSGTKYDVKFIRGSDGFAVVEWNFTGKNTGTLTLPDGSSLPATGRQISGPVVTIYEVAGGRIVAERNYWDNALLLTQLGLMPT